MKLTAEKAREGTLDIVDRQLKIIEGSIKKAMRIGDRFIVHPITAIHYEIISEIESTLEGLGFTTTTTHDETKTQNGDYLIRIEW